MMQRTRPIIVRSSAAGGGIRTVLDTHFPRLSRSLRVSRRPRVLNQFSLSHIKSPNEVVVKPSQDNASIALTQRGERRRNLGELFLVISGGPLDWQLSSTTQIFTQLSPLLSGVKTFAIGKYPSSPVGEEYVDSEQWLELFRPFRRVWSVRVTERLVQDVALALGGVADDMASGILVLPALISLFLEGHRDYPSVQEAAERFVAQRRLSGHHILAAEA
jgi:hypothetical protein